MHEYRTFYRSTGSFVDLSLKKANPTSPEIINFLIVPQLGFLDSFLDPSYDLGYLNLAQFLYMHSQSCEFTYVAVLLCLANTVLIWISIPSGFYDLLLFHNEPWTLGREFLAQTSHLEQSTHSVSYLELLIVVDLCSVIYDKKKLF